MMMMMMMMVINDDDNDDDDANDPACLSHLQGSSKLVSCPKVGTSSRWA